MTSDDLYLAGVLLTAQGLMIVLMGISMIMQSKVG